MPGQLGMGRSIRETGGERMANGRQEPFEPTQMGADAVRHQH
jgi:hypothetical protein